VGKVGEVREMGEMGGNGREKAICGVCACMSCVSEMSGTSELARALAGANVPGAYATALEAGGCGLGVLEGVWRAAEAASVGDGEETGESKGEVRDVAWAAGHKAVFERVKRCAGVGPWAGLEMYPWRVANAVAARCLAAAG
jgi:hypothetical protein